MEVTVLGSSVVSNIPVDALGAVYVSSLCMGVSGLSAVHVMNLVILFH